MRHVRLTMSAGGREGEVHEVYDLLANAPYVERVKTTHWNVSGDALGIMHYIEGDIESFRTAIAAIDDVRDYELTEVEDDSFYAYLMSVPTEGARRIFESLTRGRLVVLHPLEWDAGGTVRLSVVGTSDEIQAAIDGMPDPVTVEVTEIGGLERAAEAVETLLSDRQREAVEAALDLGYYEIPRTASHEDVADAIDCAPSTAAEHLRKAESKLLRAALRE